MALAVTEASRHVRKLRVYFNNHFEAKAVANTVILKHQLGQPVKGTYEPAFVEHFHEVRDLVRTSGLL